MELLTKQEAMKEYGLTRATIMRYINEGLPVMRVGRRYRFVKETFAAFHEAYLPLQQKLEKAFLDDKGRNLSFYKNEDEIALLLKVSLRTVQNHCKNGLPHVVVGTRRFFLTPEVLEYFEHRAKDSFPCTLLVDGSYHQDTNQMGAGLVVLRDKRTYTQSFSYHTNKKSSTVSEALAVLEGLRYTKKNHIEQAIIVTDQLEFVNRQKQPQGVQKFALRLDHEQRTEFLHLYSELRDKVTFLHPKQVPEHLSLFKEAHKLSRRYPKMANNTEKSSIVVSYRGKQSGHTHFNVTRNNKIVPAKSPVQNPVAAVIHYAFQFLETLEKGQSILIEGIRDYPSHVNDLLTNHKGTLPKTTRRMLEQLWQSGKLVSADSLHHLLEWNGKVKQKAV